MSVQRGLVDDIVEGWIEGAPAPEHPKWPSGANRGITKVSYTHDALIDFIIANPTARQGEMGAHFGYSPSWISQIISSDAFQSRLAERKDQLVDPAIRNTIEQNMQAVVRRSLEILLEKLDRPTVPDNLVLRALDVSARAAGYGARTEQAKVQVNINNHLEGLSDNLVTLLRKKKAEAEEIVDGELEGPTAS
jgi:hypothetical protein